MLQTHPTLCLRLVFASEADSGTKWQAQHVIHGSYAFKSPSRAIIPVSLLAQVPST